MNEQEWTCPNPGCGKSNYSRRSFCFRCKTTKDEKTKTDDSPQGPPGLFKKGDWSCESCGNVNWLKREKCNICQDARPDLKALVDKRDGKGGGFNERQERNINLKRREIDNDGFDDFGQRKKKVKATKEEREEAALARLQGNYGSILQLETVGPALTEFKHAPTTTSKQPPPLATKKEEPVRRGGTSSRYGKEDQGKNQHQQRYYDKPEHRRARNDHSQNDRDGRGDKSLNRKSSVRNSSRSPNRNIHERRNSNSDNTIRNRSDRSRPSRR